MTTAECPLVLTGGTVLREGMLVDDEVAIVDGHISDAVPRGAREIDCRGLHVLPGMIDIHGDAFEREIHPRPGVAFPLAIAMESVDRQLLANGITTAYHGLTVSWEPGARSLDAGRAFMAEFGPLRRRFAADHRIQIRWETFAHDAIDNVLVWLREDIRPALAFNDHTTSTIEKLAKGAHRKLGEWASRAGLTPDDYAAMVHRVGELGDAVPAAIERVAAAAREAGAPLLAHDETTSDERCYFRGLGATISEFPLTRVAAEAAVAADEHTALGAPNVVRGGSHTGAMSAAEAVSDGLCTILASDYYYPSLLHAAARLVREERASLEAVWRLVSTNPAGALGLDDRGTLAPGQRGDIVVVDWRDRGAPKVVATIVTGRIVAQHRH